MKKNLYTSKELFIIIALRNQGFTLQEISEITGRSVNSLVYKLRDIRMKRQTKRLLMTAA